MRWAAFLLALLALAGCGGEEDPPARADAEPTATATATPDEREQAKEEIRQLATDWLAAAAKADAKGQCELLIPAEQRYFDRLAGSCEKAYTPRGSAEDKRFARETARDSKPGTIIVYDKGYATIELEHSADGVYETIYAVEADGGWGIARKKVAER
jgi:hypothetical protein